MAKFTYVKGLLCSAAVAGILIITSYFYMSASTVIVLTDTQGLGTPEGIFPETDSTGQQTIIQIPETLATPKSDAAIVSHPSVQTAATSETTPTILTTVQTNVESATEQKRPFDDKMRGLLNYDVWRWIVGYLVDDMRIRRDFPNNPDERKTIDSLTVNFNERDPSGLKGKYSHKIYGYLLPSETGDYVFSIEMKQLTAACSVELWLSQASSDPWDTKKIVELTYPELGRRGSGVDKSAKSAVIHDLHSNGVYYFEFLEKVFDGRCDVEIKWKPPGQEVFSSIPNTFFAMAVKLNDQGHFTDLPIVAVLQGPLPSNELQSHQHVQFVDDTVYPITDVSVLPSCEFKSEFAYPHKVDTYGGVKQVKGSKVYPPDDTWHKRQSKANNGNERLNPDLAQRVLKLYKKAFNESKQYKGEVVKLHYLEETVNNDKGSRFLLELDIKLDNQDDVVHTSEFVYLPARTDNLCHTENFQWTKKTDVHLVVSVKNLGMWVKHLIHNMEYLYSQTHDEHFQLVIVDYESQDLDIEEELKRSSLKWWKVVHEKGPFSRSGGLQAGIDYITDPNSIIMTIDMHLTLPPGFVEYVRRHVVKGKMGFAPMFFRLRPGYTEININGFWETLTYGLFGLYKSDWTAIGGFDVEKYTVKWGGEDWDVLDKAVANGYETFRLRYPGLMHYHHTKAGMWGNKNR